MVASAKVDKSKPPVFHQNELARGWRILHEHVKIRVDLERRAISGTATFNFSALNAHCVSFALNMRRCRVNSCLIKGRPSAFRFVSPLDDRELFEAVSSETGRHRVRNIEHSMQLREEVAMNQGEVATSQGELIVYLPASISADVIDELKVASEKAPTPPVGLDGEADLYTVPAVPLDQLPTLQLIVDYEILDPTAGAMFYGDPSDLTGVLDPVYMLTNTRVGMARFWMPCLDTMAWCDRYLFDFDVAVKSGAIVIASGELVETRAYSGDEMSDSDVRTAVNVYRYRLHTPAHASEILLAVGPFVVVPDPILANTVTHFCLPGRAKELVYTCPPLFAKAVAFCRDYFGSDPPTSSFKHVFVGSNGSRADTTMTGAGGIVVYSGDLLHNERSIDESLAAREAIMSGMVMSYFGRFLRPRASEDDWLIRGLAAHVTSLGLQAILGRNWYRFHIMDLIHDLQQEKSCDLSNVKSDRITDTELDSVKRRSHIIVYMIEKRIGSDVMKRALRDIVAESRSVTVAIVKVLEVSLSKPLVASDDTLDEHVSKPNPQPPRVLLDLNGDDPEQIGSSVVVSTGFDDAVHGIGVGPFLKRLRAICGTDVRGLVRLWAASSGVPRMQIAYSYNPRKHALDFAVKQEGLGNSSDYNRGKGLLFSGQLHVKVLEMEGTYEHTVEVRDQYCVAEIPCHSRRAKHKSGAQAEKEFNENPARASPVIWLRVDPDNELCKDLIFKQDEDAWTAQLKGERDAVSQFEACRGLSAFRSAGAAKSLLALLEDEQLYWRVRAEAAYVLAACEGGLDMLLSYFRSCYTDGGGKTMGLVRPNNFSNLANYFVKRAMINAIAQVRVKGSHSRKFPEGSVPVKAAEFLRHMLSTNDNTGNEFDDDHYVVDLVKACGKIGSLCIGDNRHSTAGDGGRSTTMSTMQQLERYRSIEQLMPGRPGIVAAAVTEALCDIEVAMMAFDNKRDGQNLSNAILSGRFTAKDNLLNSIEELSSRRNPEDIRLVTMTSLAKAYAGNLDFASWLIGKCFRDSSGVDMLDEYWTFGESRRSRTNWGFIEAPTFRYRVLNALTEAALSSAWDPGLSPLLLAVRRHTKRAGEFCLRIQRLIVGDPHPRVRYSALRFAKIAWGAGVPVCLLARMEYKEMKRQRPHIQVADIVPLKTAGSPVKLPGPQPVRAVKVSKPLKASKSSKNGKTSKGSKRKALNPENVFHTSPLTYGGAPSMAPIDLVTEYETQPRRNVKAEVKYDTSVLKKEPELKPSIRLPSKIPLSVPKSAPVAQTKTVPKSARAVPTSTARVAVPKSTREQKTGGFNIPKSVPSAPKGIPNSGPRSATKSTQPTVPKSVSKGIPISIRIPKSAPTNSPQSAAKNEPRLSTSLNIPRSKPTSIPRSVPKIPLSVVPKKETAKSDGRFPFSWHPLDKEDINLMKRASENYDDLAPRKRARIDNEHLRVVSNDERRLERSYVESRESSFHNEAQVITHGTPEIANGADGEKKKKKKKKKKRHLDGEDGHRKKKKKKKHHRDGESRYADGKSDGPGDIQEGGSSSAQPRLGTLKIKVPSEPL